MNILKKYFTNLIVKQLYLPLILTLPFNTRIGVYFSAVNKSYNLFKKKFLFENVTGVTILFLFLSAILFFATIRN